ncbi:MAG: hypothetical protein HOK28_14520, partial [Deltaproteobacteria bacterium]|nr:hypothetical protein [Deltaproteobacteria bacterium]
MHTFPSGVLQAGRFGSFLTAASLVLTLVVVTGCNTRPTTGGLQGVEIPTPEAEPCGGDCPDGTICVPVIDENGEPAFACLDVHLRYCSPCLEDSDCIDPFMPDAGSLCVTREDGSGSYCATDCAEHTDCPEGAYCLEREDGRAVCMPENLNCECSEWATENEMVTQCSTANVNGTCIGQRICNEDGLTECDAPIAQEEICNEADDNCNGLVDESFPTEGEACDGGDGDLCSDGALTCDRGLVICLEDPTGRSESCNGLDDDCDSVVDNNLVNVSADNQQGICAGSVKDCSGEAGWTEPDYMMLEGFEADEQTCDGLDNDCDGDTDERFGAEGEIAFTDVDASTRYLGDTCGVGVCAGGSVVCSEDGESLICDSVEGAQAETCDGLDNDCDGQVDEGFDAPLSTLQDGVCAGMVKVCGGIGGWVEPDY